MTACYYGWHALSVFSLELSVDRAAIVGFSMGGVIAQCFAIHYPEMTNALVIAASSSVVNRQAVEYFLERAKLAETQGLEAVRERSSTPKSRTRGSESRRGSDTVSWEDPAGFNGVVTDFLSSV